MNDSHPTLPTDVASAFAGYPEPIRADLLRLRRLVLDSAAELEHVGPIEETLRWGQPSYLTTTSMSGSTIRLAPAPVDSHYDYGMYFICRTNLIESFKHMFGDKFTYEGTRGILFEVDQVIPEEELKECVAIALTYHQTRTN